MSVTFAKDGTSAVLRNPDLDDKLDLDTHQVVQPKAGGGFYRYALAAAADKQRELRWSHLLRSELDALLSFFEFTAQGMLNEFTFTDERGGAWTAHFLNPTLDPVTVHDDAASTGTYATGGVTRPTTTRGGGYYSLAFKLHLATVATTTGAGTTAAPTTASPTAAPTDVPTTSPATTSA